MARAILDYQVEQPAEYTLTDEYKAFIESMVGYLINDAGTSQENITPDEGYRFRGDMTAFLLEKNVPLEDHYLILRMNGLTGFDQIDQNLNTILVPDQAVVSQLKQLYRSKPA